MTNIKKKTNWLGLSFLCLVMPYVLENIRAWKGNWRGGKLRQKLTTVCFFCSISKCSTSPSSATSNGVWPWCGKRRQEDIRYGVVPTLKKSTIYQQSTKVNTAHTLPPSQMLCNTLCFTPEQESSAQWWWFYDSIHDQSNLNHGSAAPWLLLLKSKHPGPTYLSFQLLKRTLVLRRNVINLFYHIITYLNLQQQAKKFGSCFQIHEHLQNKTNQKSYFGAQIKKSVTFSLQLKL